MEEKELEKEAEKELNSNQEKISTREKKKPGFFTGLAAGVGVVVLAGLVLGTVCVNTGVITLNGKDAAENSVVSAETQKKLETLKGLVNLNYYDDTTDTDFSDGLCAGLIEALDDPYSEYYSVSEYKDFVKLSTRQYYGIGAGLSQDKETMQVTITYVYDNTPAKEAGLKEGDIIVSVDGTDATSMELDALVEMIQGDEGTNVHLQIYREGEADYLEKDITRATVNLPSVDYKMLENNIGYIDITKFATDTANEFEAAVLDLALQGMTSMIIDVRYNPGGQLNSVVSILDDILPEGTVVYTEDKYGNRQDEVSSGDTSMDYPLAVLVNGNSASASEILAGAVRDFNYGTIIGTTTYGKGCVQKTYQLTDGSAVKLTVEKYFTPSGDYIQDKGITPDVELEYEFLGTADDEYDWTLDNQIMKAVEILEQQ